MEVVNPQVEAYLRTLQGRYDDEVLDEMEAEAARRSFPAVGRLVGVSLELLARAIGARRVFELGSGFGYSAYWFSRAVGAEGEIHLTDRDPRNRDRAQGFLSRAGLDGPIEFHVGDAFEGLESVDGEFDVIFCDIDKEGYPEAWRRARERVRVGGVYCCDNVLAAGRVTWTDPDPDWAERAEAVKEANKAIASDPDFRSFINPTRDGVVAALRIR